YVEMEFGTGCLKVTPAHDANDFMLGQKHNLLTINMMNADGTLSEAAGHYIGEDRFDVRKKIEGDLDAAGALVKIEDYPNKVGYSERTDVVIEPRLSMQWWVDMKELSEPALENVMNDNIKFHPSKFKNTYKHWMENIKDWCISRQLWWGHRIPAFYYGEGDDDFVVAKSESEALELARVKSGNPHLANADLKQDEDVLDTWFSSWLWPISVFDGFYSSEEVDYYYPTNDLVTAPEIMFFWVARMIIAGYEYRGELPFRNVYYTGIVRDKQGRKMSKSLGNSPDPIELMKEYGADGVRVGMLLTSPAGNDLPFDAKLCEQGRNFANKIWNAFRLVQGWTVEDKPASPAALKGIEWFDSQLSRTIASLNENYDQFRISDALMTTYKLIWDDFCAWYLEMVKPPYGESISREAYECTVDYFERVLKLIHPFMPFLSEEVWQYLRERKSPQDSIVLAQWPNAEAPNDSVLHGFEQASEVVSNIRTIRTNNNIPNKQGLELAVKVNKGLDESYDAVIQHLCNVSSIQKVDAAQENAFSFIVKGNEYFVPFGENVDVESEKEKLQKELEYAIGLLNIVEKKLSNERFVNNAPEAVVASEKKKQDDTREKIKILEEKLSSLN
ncbi:MAG: class I tRNA ligase family protein, partial [Flavobacteriales bacterium]|nr:class I tRNA ligase family protein [Flavobacteriales bacterium]